MDSAKRRSAPTANAEREGGQVPSPRGRTPRRPRPTPPTLRAWRAFVGRVVRRRETTAPKFPPDREGPPLDFDRWHRLNVAPAQARQAALRPSGRDRRRPRRFRIRVHDPDHARSRIGTDQRLGDCASEDGFALRTADRFDPRETPRARRLVDRRTNSSTADRERGQPHQAILIPYNDHAELDRNRRVSLRSPPSKQPSRERHGTPGFAGDPVPLISESREPVRVGDHLAG